MFVWLVVQDLRLSIDHNMWSKNVEDLQQHYDAVAAAQHETQQPDAATDRLSPTIVESLQGGELNPLGVPLDFVQLK